MAPKPLRPTSVVVPWPGHWHLHLGSSYFSAPFDPAAHKAARRYLAMESLKARRPRCHTASSDVESLWVPATALASLLPQAVPVIFISRPAPA